VTAQTEETDMPMTHPPTTDRHAEPDRPRSERLVEHRTHRGELRPHTEAGRRFVASAEELTEQLTEAAAAHDRDRSYPFAALREVRDTGLPWAAAPEEVGGWGLASVHDLIVGSSRLARANPSLTIGLNMHLLAMDLLAHRGRCDAVDRDGARRARIGVERIARHRVLMASAISEHAQDLLRPRTRATGVGDGFVVDGRKAFCTMSPAADLLTVAVAYRRDDGQERIGFVQLPRTSPGITIEDDWDALGMRSSGSHSVTLDQVRVDSNQLQDAFPFGHADRSWLDRYLTSGLGHAAAGLGIAEAAHATVTSAGPDRRALRANDPRALMSVAENAIDLAAVRATLAAAALSVDRYRDRIELGDPGAVADASEEMASVQRAKAFVDRTAVRVVDRSLELSGGAGYLDAHPLSRAWRDVRAGAFMHPYGANRGYAIIGAIELGEEPKLG
jgi:alkylation response protein AidB-like acyl-CoA dehydrogenase